MPIDVIRRQAAVAFSRHSLFFKAAAFGLSWLFLPFWLFLIVGLYFYFVPFFRPFKLSAPLILTFVAAAIVPNSFWFAIFLGFLFFLLIGIKNLILVDRFNNHQLLVFLILFMIFFGFFSGLENWQKWVAAPLSLGIGLSFFVLFYELADYIKEDNLKYARDKIIIAALGSLLIWQAASVILFLHVNHYYQTALLFLSSVVLTDILLDYSGGKLGRRKILSDFSVFFALSALILASANWGL